MVFGVAGGWTTGEFQLYWALGAVLNVPFLAGGELMLLVRNRTAQAAIWILLVFLTAYTVSVLRGATFDAAALAEDLPSGKDVFGDGSPAHRLPQLISIPSYLVLLGGALWSAWRMRGRPELRRPVRRHAADRPRRDRDRGLRVGVRGAGPPRRLLVALAVGDQRDVLGFLRASGAVRAPSGRRRR